MDTGPHDVHSLLIDRSQELDAMLESVESCLEELLKSPEFKDQAWFTEADVGTLDPDNSMNLFALTGPPSMTIDVTVQGGTSHQMVCQTDKGDIELRPIRSARARAAAPFLDVARLRSPHST
jgi:hypothetical protein